MARKLAVKRLSAVEVDPGRSNQHEFNADRIHAEIGLSDKRESGLLRLHVHTADGGLVVDEDDFTLYDARERHPTRSEWRLYYRTNALADYASPGDLLVLFRPDGGEIAGIVAPKGSTVEVRLLALLELAQDFDLERFTVVNPESPSATEAAEVMASLTLWDAPSISPATGAYPHTRHSIVQRAIDDDRMPTTHAMAAAATEVTAAHVDAGSEPDLYLTQVMAAESDLFFAIETVVEGRRLDTLMAQGSSVSSVLKWAMSIHQARRSRRGQSLQSHFETVLLARGIRHSAQCTTEQGETPDFVMPGCAEYQDPSYPAAALRMVACKSTSKERWRQVLNEAKRVRPKYLLTLDTRLTIATVTQMLLADLLPHLPRPIIDTEYQATPVHGHLQSVKQLLGDLEAATL